jgi:hypothetical protein
VDPAAEAPPEDGNFDGLCPPPNARIPTSERLVRGSNSTFVQDHSRTPGGGAQSGPSRRRETPLTGEGPKCRTGPAHRPSSGPSLLDIIYIIGVFVEADPNRETASPPLDPFVNITPYGVIVPSVSIKCPVILG